MYIVFANGPGDLGSIPGPVIPKTPKWYLMPPCLTLSIIRFGSRVKCSNHIHLAVVAIEKRGLGHRRLWSPTTLYIYIYIYLESLLKVMIVNERL